MATIEPREKRKLELLFRMSGGFVLELTNKEFSSIFKDAFNINIYDDKYADLGTSKANRLRVFWMKESNLMVGKSILELIEIWMEEIALGKAKIDDNFKIITEQCRKIASVLVNNEELTTLSEIEENMFLEKEYKRVDTKTLNVDSTMADAIEQRINEIQICLNNNAPLAAIFLIGSTLEGLLINLASKNIINFNQAIASPKKNDKVLKLNEWTLSSLIDVAGELNFINEDVKKHSHSLRDFRNYIHPSEQVKSKFNPNKHTALISWQVLQAAISTITKNQNGH